MSITFLENTSKFNFAGVRFVVESTVSGTNVTWDYTYSSTTLISFRDFLKAVNVAMDSINSTNTPVFEIEQGQYIEIWNNTIAKKYSETAGLTLFTVDIYTDTLIVEKAFGLSLLIDRSVSPAKYSSTSDVLGIGAFRLPYALQLSAYCNANDVTGGLEPSDPIEEVGIGEDYISFAGADSSDYRVISGLEFPYRYHISLAHWLQDFFDFSRNSELQFANDTYNIGEGKLWQLLPHSGAKMSTVYAYLDIVKKGIRLIRIEEFTEVDA